VLELTGNNVNKKTIDTVIENLKPGGKGVSLPAPMKVMKRLEKGDIVFFWGEAEGEPGEDAMKLQSGDVVKRSELRENWSFAMLGCSPNNTYSIHHGQLSHAGGTVQCRHFRRNASAHLACAIFWAYRNSRYPFDNGRSSSIRTTVYLALQRLLRERFWSGVLKVESPILSAKERAR